MTGEYMPYTPEHRVNEIAERHGKAAASWIFNGNTTRETYRVVKRMLGDGDPIVYDLYNPPNLSGEYEDYSESDLMAEAGWVPNDGTDLRDELADQYNREASESFWHEIERLAGNGSENDEQAT